MICRGPRALSPKCIAWQSKNGISIPTSLAQLARLAGPPPPQSSTDTQHPKPLTKNESQFTITTTSLTITITSTTTIYKETLRKALRKCTESVQDWEGKGPASRASQANEVGMEIPFLLCHAIHLGLRARGPRRITTGREAHQRIQT